MFVLGVLVIVLVLFSFFFGGVGIFLFYCCRLVCFMSGTLTTYFEILGIVIR